MAKTSSIPLKTMAPPPLGFVAPPVPSRSRSTADAPVSRHGGGGSPPPPAMKSMAEPPVDLIGLSMGSNGAKSVRMSSRQYLSFEHEAAAPPPITAGQRQQESLNLRGPCDQDSMRSAILQEVTNGVSLKKVAMELKKDSVEGEGAGAGMPSALSAALSKMKMAKEVEKSVSEPGGEAEEDKVESMGFGLFDDDSPYMYVATSDREKKVQPKSLSERREIEEEDEEAIMGFDLFGNEPLEEKGKEIPKPKPEPSSGPTYPQVHPSNLTELFKHQTEDGHWVLDDVFLVILNSEKILAILEAAGAKSLGSSVYRTILKLLATVLVLKALALNFPSQFPLVFAPKIGIAGKVDIQFEKGVKKAVDFVTNTERVNPGLPSHLELGYNWDATCNCFLKDCQL